MVRLDFFLHQVPNLWRLLSPHLPRDTVASVDLGRHLRTLGDGRLENDRPLCLEDRLDAILVVQ